MNTEETHRDILVDSRNLLTISNFLSFTEVISAQHARAFLSQNLSSARLARTIRRLGDYYVALPTDPSIAEYSL